MSGIIDSVGSKSGVVGSDVYPAGHIINTWRYVKPFTSLKDYAPSTTFSTVDFGGTDEAIKITGISATAGNWLYMSGSGFAVQAIDDGTYQVDVGFIIDGSKFSTSGTFYGAGLEDGAGTGRTSQSVSPSLSWIYTVPSSFTNKEISVGAKKEGGNGTFKLRSLGYGASWGVHLTIFEIQQ